MDDRSEEISEYVEYTPVPDPINHPGVQTPKFTDAELSRIVRNACPSGWKKVQVQANLCHLSLAAQTRYYTGLKSVESSEPTSHQNKMRDGKTNNPQKNETGKTKNPKANRNYKYCNIHVIRPLTSVK
jgi:hypothetical protein